MIREANLDDAESIVEIYNHFIATSIATFEETPLSIEEMHGRMQKILLQGLPWLVAVENSQITGYAYAGFWNPRSAYRFSLETTAYIAPNMTGKGFGTDLYATLFSRIKDFGAHTVMAGITLPNPASVRLHEKFGMQKVANFSEVGFKLDQWLDVGYWQLVL